MKITPYIGESEFEPSNIRFEVRPEDKTRVDLLVTAAKQLDSIFDDADESAVMTMRSSIKGLLTVIDKSRESVKAPFLNAGRGIDAKAKDYSGPLDVEEKRLRALVEDYALEKAQSRERERRQAQAILDARRKEEEDKLVALKKAPEATDSAIMRQELEVELATHTVVVKDHDKPLIAGGQTKREPRFRLISPEKLFESNPKLAVKLIDPKLRIRACQDLVKDMFDSGMTEEQVFIPGVEIIFVTAVGIRGTSQIVSK